MGSNGTEIVASFIPGRTLGGLTLSEAELVLGYDHFNWVQTIREPVNMRLEIWRNVTSNAANGRPLDGEFIGIPSPAYDPVPNLGGDRYYLRADRNQLNDVIYMRVNDPDPAGADASEPFLQEFPADWRNIRSGGSAGGTFSKSEFLFYDVRSVPASLADIYLLPNSFTSFTTQLIGVKDGDWEVLNGGRTGFTWKNNAIHGTPADRIVYLNGGPADVPPIIGGGTFDVRYNDDTQVPGFPIEAPLYPRVQFSH